MTQISYDHGVSDKKLIGQTIGAFFDRAVETWRDREALVVRQQDVRWSWGELGRRVDDLAAGLLSLGLERGDRVGIWAPNRSEWTLAQFATAKAGLVLVNVNPAYRRSELEYAMNKVECKALILAPALKTSNYLEITDDLVKAGKLPHLKHIVRLGAEKTPGMLNFDDVATGNLVTKSNHLAIYFGADTLVADFGVHRISEIDRSGAGRKFEHAAFGSEGIHFVRREIDF